MIKKYRWVRDKWAFDVSIALNYHDIYFGVYWKLDDYLPLHSKRLSIFVCIIPMLPIKFAYAWITKR